MIDKVIAFANGIVMVFDQDGKQLPQFQGKIDKVSSLILDAATEDTVFYAGVWKRGVWEISREQFQSGDFLGVPVENSQEIELRWYKNGSS